MQIRLTSLFLHSSIMDGSKTRYLQVTVANLSYTNPHWAGTLYIHVVIHYLDHCEREIDMINDY